MTSKLAAPMTSKPSYLDGVPDDARRDYEAIDVELYDSSDDAAQDDDDHDEIDDCSKDESLLSTLHEQRPSRHSP